MFTRAFWLAAIERAVKTFGQAAAALLLGDGLGLLDADWAAVANLAGMAAAISLLTSLGSLAAGPGGSPSLVTGPADVMVARAADAAYALSGAARAALRSGLPVAPEQAREVQVQADQLRRLAAGRLPLDTPRNRWRTAFLVVTALAIGMELTAAADHNPDTEPWTDLIVTYVPGEAIMATIGALSLWLIVHFGRRIRRRALAQRVSR
jgi:hypothetical protein